MTSPSTTAPSDHATSRLRAGFPVILAAGVAADPHRILLSSGVACVSGQIYEGCAYRDPAFVPKLPWRQPTSEELTLLSPASLKPPGREFVGVVRVSNKSWHAFQATGVNAKLDRTTYRHLLVKDDVSKAIEDCLHDLAPYVDDTSCLKALGFTICEAGSATVAPWGNEPQVYQGVKTSLPHRWLNSKLLEGLHVDDYDGADVRAETRNRIHLNLGPEPRHFLFVNLPIDELCSDPSNRPASAVGAVSKRGTCIGNAFLESHLDYPVVRLRINPGEAYIAPTDAMIHDGDTMGKTLPDVTYSLLGGFSISGDSASLEWEHLRRETNKAAISRVVEDSQATSRARAAVRPPGPVTGIRILDTPPPSADDPAASPRARGAS